MEDVEELARACPQDLDIRLVRGDTDGLAHVGDRIASRIGDTSGEDGNDRRHSRRESRSDLADLMDRENRGDVAGYPVARQTRDERSRTVTARVRHGNLDVHVRAPDRKSTRLNSSH